MSNFPMLSQYVENYKNKTLNEFSNDLTSIENVQLINELFFLNHTLLLGIIELKDLFDLDYDKISNRLIEYMELCKNYKKSYIKNKRNIYQYREKNREKYNELNKKYTTEYSKKRVTCPHCQKNLSQGYLKTHLAKKLC